MQAVLGHTSSKSTDIYTHLTNRRIFLEMEKLNKRIKENQPIYIKELVALGSKGPLARIIPLLEKMDEGKLEKIAGLLEMMAAA